MTWVQATFVHACLCVVVMSLSEDKIICKHPIVAPSLYNQMLAFSLCTPAVFIQADLFKGHCFPCIPVRTISYG